MEVYKLISCSYSFVLDGNSISIVIGVSHYGEFSDVVQV